MNETWLLANENFEIHLSSEPAFNNSDFGSGCVNGRWNAYLDDQIIGENMTEPNATVNELFLIDLMFKITIILLNKIS